MGILVFDGDQGRKRNHDGDLVDVKKRQHIVCSGDNLRGMKNENMGGQIQCLVLFRVAHLRMHIYLEPETI